MLQSPLPGGPLSQGLAAGSDVSDGRKVSLLADHKQQTNARPKYPWPEETGVAAPPGVLSAFSDG